MGVVLRSADLTYQIPARLIPTLTSSAKLMHAMINSPPWRWTGHSNTHEPTDGQKATVNSGRLVSASMGGTTAVQACSLTPWCRSCPAEACSTSEMAPQASRQRDHLLRQGPLAIWGGKGRGGIFIGQWCACRPKPSTGHEPQTLNWMRPSVGLQKSCLMLVQQLRCRRAWILAS